MEKELQTKVVGKYAGHSVKANKSVDLGFVLGYDQLTGAVQLLQYLNVDVDVTAKIPNEKPLKLGNFRVNKVNIDHDGESSIKFNGMDDFVDTDAINKLVGSELIQIRFDATVDVQDEDDEE